MTPTTIQANTPVDITIPAGMVQNIAVMLASHPYKDVAEILNMLQTAMNNAAAKLPVSESPVEATVPATAEAETSTPKIPAKKSR